MRTSSPCKCGESMEVRPRKITVMQVNRLVFFKGLCVGLVICLCMAQPFDVCVASADLVTPPTSKSSILVPSLAFQNLDQFTVPESVGFVKKIHSGNSGRLIILIEDAHANLSVQHAIAKLLRYLNQIYAVRWVALEGAHGELNTHLLNGFADAGARHDVAGYFLRKGRIGGPEYWAWRAQPDVHLFGAEDRALYEENVQSYLKALSVSAEARDQLELLCTMLEDASRYIFSEAWRKFRVSQFLFTSGQNSLAKYLSDLALTAEALGLPLDSYPLMQSLYAASSQKAVLSFTANEKTIDDQIDKMKLSIAKDRVTVFLTNAAQYRMKKIPQGEYYGYLADEITRRYAGTAIAETEQFLVNHFRFSHACAHLGAGWRESLSEIERALKGVAVFTPDEKELDSLLAIQELLTHLYELRLTRPEADYFFDNHSLFSSATFVKRVPSLLAKYKVDTGLPPRLAVVDRDLPKLEHFYKQTMARDRKLVEQATDLMASQKQTVIALVSGGFHTAGIERFLEDRHDSYVVILPAAAASETERDTRRHEEALRKIPLSLDRLLSNTYRAKTFSLQVGAPLSHLAAPLLTPMIGNEQEMMQSKQSPPLLTALRLLFVLGRLRQPQRDWATQAYPAAEKVGPPAFLEFVQAEADVPQGAALKMTLAGDPVLLNTIPNYPKTAFAWTPGTARPSQLPGFRKPADAIIRFRSGYLSFFSGVDPSTLSLLDYDPEKSSTRHVIPKAARTVSMPGTMTEAADTLARLNANPMASVGSALFLGPLGAASRKADPVIIAGFKPAESAAMLQATLSGAQMGVAVIDHLKWLDPLRNLAAYAMPLGLLNLTAEPSGGSVPRWFAEDKAISLAVAANLLWKSQNGTGYLQSLYESDSAVREGIRITRDWLRGTPQASQKPPHESGGIKTDDTPLTPEAAEGLKKRMAVDWNYFRVLTAPREISVGHFRLPAADADASLSEESSRLNSLSSIGGYLRAILASERLGSAAGGASPQEAGARMRDLVLELQRLPRYRGFFFHSYGAAASAPGASYQVTEKEVFFADNKWIESGLKMVLVAAHSFEHTFGLAPETAAAIQQILNGMNFREVFYDKNSHVFYRSIQIASGGKVTPSTPYEDSLSGGARQHFISEIGRMGTPEGRAFLERAAGRHASADNFSSDDLEDRLMPSIDLDEVRNFPDALGLALPAADKTDQDKTPSSAVASSTR